MNDAISRMMSDLLGKVDEKVLRAKINAAVEMMKNGDLDELAKKICRTDKDELLKKVNEMDENKLKELNIDRDALKGHIGQNDLKKLSSLIGEHGDEIVDRLKTLMKL